MIDKHYSGAKALSYETDRRRQPKWKWERKIMRRVLDGLGDEIESVIDAPVGTGRFLDLYRVPVTGFDYSRDMLASARLHGSQAILLQHDLLKRDLLAWADLVVCFRFLNLIDSNWARLVLRRLLGAANKYAVFTVRTVKDDYTSKMSVGRVFLHRRRVIAKTIKRCGFEVVRRFEFKDKVPGLYDIVLCKRVEDRTE